jgi:transcriptional regulator with XRE-family HTH domain
VSGRAGDPGRNCAGCGRPLSRYNTGPVCQGCVSADRKSHPGRPGKAGETLVDRGRLAQLRHDRGWTQELLAGRAGVSTELVKKLEQGVKRSARLSTLGALARALDVPVGVLLGENAPGEPAARPARPAGENQEPRQEGEPGRPTLLRALIAERHWHRFPAFAAQFRRAARELAERDGDPDLAKLTVSSRQWERWYSGNVRTEPYPDACRVLEHLFGYPVRQLLAPAGQQIGSDRRGVHSGDIRELTAWVASTNTTDDAIAQIAHVAAYLAEAHSRIPQRTVLAGVLQAHQKAGDLLRSGKQRLRQTRELLRIDSELLAYACLLLGNLGQDLKADEYGTAALILAQEAGCDEAIAWSAQAKTARWQQKYVESAEAARRGFEVSTLSPVNVELAYREANAIALFGDTGRARQALQRAQEAAGALPANRGSPMSVWSFPAGRQAIFELSVAIHTGDPDSALRAAAMADAAWASGEPRVPANWAQIRAGSSIACLMKGSLDEAVYHVAPVLELPRELRISTVTGYLRRLEELLAESRFAQSAAAAGLALQIRDFISSAPLGTDETAGR